MTKMERNSTRNMKLYHLKANSETKGKKRRRKRRRRWRRRKRRVACNLISHCVNQPISQLVGPKGKQKLFG